MAAEQMRMELESFVNQGLQEDWRGWPMKGRLSGQEEYPDADCLVPLAGMVLGSRFLAKNSRFCVITGKIFTP